MDDLAFNLNIEDTLSKKPTMTFINIITSNPSPIKTVIRMVANRSLALGLGLEIAY